MMNLIQIKKIVWFIGLVLFCSSCITIIIIKGKGIHSGYNELSESEKERIVFLSDIEQIKDHVDTVIFAITAPQLKNYINQFDSCLIYFWSPFCASPNCKSPEIVQNYCKTNHLHLILIVEDYSSAQYLLTILSLFEQPAFVINSFYYKTDFCPIYVPKFKHDFIGRKSRKDNHARYYIYHASSYKAVNTIDEKE